ncbi:MAG: hypothetical protein AB1861_06475, partial [Cyanobacteriota bacterium]
MLIHTRGRGFALKVSVECIEQHVNLRKRSRSLNPESAIANVYRSVALRTFSKSSIVAILSQGINRGAMGLMHKIPEDTSHWTDYSQEMLSRNQQQVMPWAWIEQASVTRTEDFEQSQRDATFQPSPLHLDSTLEELTLYDASIESERAVEEVIQIFEANPLLPGMIITEQGNFVGMISRRRFFENMSRLYSLELSAQRSVKELYSIAQ